MEAKTKGLREVLIIKYEEFIVDPFREINRVYEFLGEDKLDRKSVV
jgi:hypothetical protein